MSVSAFGISHGEPISKEMLALPRGETGRARPHQGPVHDITHDMWNDTVRGRTKERARYHAMRGAQKADRAMGSAKRAYNSALRNPRTLRALQHAIPGTYGAATGGGMGYLAGRNNKELKTKKDAMIGGGAFGASIPALTTSPVGRAGIAPYLTGVGMGAVSGAYGGKKGFEQRKRNEAAKKKRVKKNLENFTEITKLSQKTKDQLGDPKKVAAVGALLGAAAIPRVRANQLGGKIAGRVVSHGKWSEGRASQMIWPKGQRMRYRYAHGLQNRGKAMGRSDDTREVTGRLASGAALGGLAGGTTYVRRKRAE